MAGDRGLSLRQGSIVDATLVQAPSSTKNKDGKRDPEMHQAKKSNQVIKNCYDLCGLVSASLAWEQSPISDWGERLVGGGLYYMRLLAECTPCEALDYSSDIKLEQS